MIVGVLRQTRAQLARPRHRLCRLLGEVERGARRGDLGMAGVLLGDAVERLARLGEVALGDHRPGEAGLRLDIGGLALQDLRIDARGAGVVARLQGLLRHRHRFLDRRGAAALAAADPLDELLDLALRLRADKAVDRPAVLEGVNRRDRLDAHLLRDLRVFVDVELDHAHRAVGGAYRLFEDRAELLARAAPRRPEIDDDRSFE